MLAGHTAGRCLKNFPHQHNRFSKLRATLEAIRDLQGAGSDPGEDGVLGDELARRQIHCFRGVDYSDDGSVEQRVENQLVEEHEKPVSSQGTRTAARENRKTLRHLGWIQHNGIDLTEAGEALFESSPGSGEESAIIRPAVAQIAVTDADGRTSHPVRILLRLVDSVEFDSRDGMELALEARDDSEGEFQRVRDLAQLSSHVRRQKLLDLGTSVNKIENARKILPRFAENAGLMLQSDDEPFVLTEVGRHTIGRGPALRTPRPETGTQGRRSRRRGTVTTTGDSDEVGRSRPDDAARRRALTGDEQQAAAELLYERTERHQSLVRATARYCWQGTFSEDRASYDLLVESDAEDPVDLIEAKTIDGDVHSQIRTAVGQLRRAS